MPKNTIASQDNKIQTEEISVHLSDSNIKDISHAIEEQDSDTVNANLEDLTQAETADLIAKLNEEEREQLVGMYTEAIDPHVFTELDDELQRQTLAGMNIDTIAEIISGLESDDALQLIENMDENIQKDVIRKLSAKTRVTLEEGLTFPEDSAGRLMQRETVAIPHFWTAGKTIDYIREAADELPEDFFDIFVIDPAYHIMGQIPLNKLVRAKRSHKIEEVCLVDIQTIPSTMDQEEVAHIFRRDNITSAPVTDENNRLLGVITIDDVIDVIDEEAEEDIFKLAGVDHGDMYRAVLSTTGTRFRWLFINLITAILASVVISFFDATIQQIVALAVLMPIVASMGGNAGTQALTVAVRALATKEISSANTWRMIGKETAVGSLNGILFALIAGFIAAFWFDNGQLGTVIALAMIINLFVAGFFGTTIPIVLDRMGKDPAVASTVFLTTITDVIGFFAFLGLASVML